MSSKANKESEFERGTPSFLYFTLSALRRNLHVSIQLRVWPLVLLKETKDVWFIFREFIEDSSLGLDIYEDRVIEEYVSRLSLTSNYANYMVDTFF